MRVVFDSNIFISAWLFPGKPADKALMKIIAGTDQLLLSKPIVNEVLQVLARKFARAREELARVAVLLADLGETVRPRRRISILKDEADNRILECALGGRADRVVTGDHAMLELENFSGIPIISLKAYLET